MLRAIVIMLIATAAAHVAWGDSPEVLEELPNTHAYTGPRLDAIAIYIRGTGGWATELPKQLAIDLKANGVRAVNATALATTAIDEREVFKRIQDAGFSSVMIVDVAGASQLNGMLMPSSTLTLQVQVRDINGTYSWRTNYNQHSSVIGRGGKLVRAASKHVIAGMRKDGLIRTD